MRLVWRNLQWGLRFKLHVSHSLTDECMYTAYISHEIKFQTSFFLPSTSIGFFFSCNPLNHSTHGHTIHNA